MPHLLTKLLEGEGRPVTLALRDLEAMTGQSGIDVRLIADIIEKTHAVMGNLRLDITDSTAHEVYAALNASVGTGQAEGLLADTKYVLASIGGDIVSLNLEDVIENRHHQLSFKDRSMHCGQRSLRIELLQRYAHKAPHPDRVIEMAQEFGLEVTDIQPRKAESAATKTPSILAIGDIFTDAFIKLSEDVARVDTDPDGSKRLSLPFGSKPPYEQVDIIQSVGPAPNAAVSFARLGLNAGLMSYLGDDLPGKDSLVHLKKERVDTSVISVERGLKSNYYYVLRLGAERTILVKNESYGYSWQKPATTPDWIYLSLISGNAWKLHEDLLDYLQAHPKMKLAFQPGTFHFEWGAKKLAKLYRRSHIIVLNREEAVDVTNRSYDDLPALAKGLHDLGPKIVVITDGPNGSYASFDGRLVTIPNYPDPAPPVDRTGAGDAFASTIVAALAMGEDMATALTWAPINSMSVVQQLGAQAGLLDQQSIRRLADTAPSSYKITEITS